MQKTPLGANAKATKKAGEGVRVCSFYGGDKEDLNHRGAETQRIMCVARRRI